MNKAKHIVPSVTSLVLRSVANKTSSRSIR